jgi:rSAM/selenodomain-associated transferase 2
MISVVIPTLNEADTIECSLNDLLSHDGDFEVIVSDGGSSDGTLEKVCRFPEVKLITSAQGRGGQMNEGAKTAKGDIFLFLHADTRLPPHALHMINEVMSDASVVGGSFCLAFDHQDLILRIYSFFSRINHILFTYGDQGLFLRSATFRSIEGFKEIPIMEDVEIQRRLRSMGRFKKFSQPAVTSARRFRKGGIIQQQILNTALVVSYFSGVPPSILKFFYRDSMEKSR